MLKPRRIIGCMTALVAGCARYKPQPISPADNAHALDSRTLDDPRLQKFIAFGLGDGMPDPISMWDLPRLTLAAIYYHPDLDIAHAKLAGANASVVTASQRPNPKLGFTSIVSEVAVAGAIPAGAAFILETFGKREYRTAQARHLADAARWDLATAGWQVRGRVRTALLNLNLWALVTVQLEVAAISRFDAVVQQRQALGALEDALQQPLFDPGRWPTVPEQNPRLAEAERSW